MEKKIAFGFFVLLAVLIGLSGCAPLRMPLNQSSFGPTIEAYPPPGKSYQAFQYDQSECRNWAFNQVGGQPALDAIAQHQANNAVAGSIGGAIVGGLLGILVRRPVSGAIIGGALGGMGGSSGGAYDAEMAMRDLQYRYNGAYLQCMQARGNYVPRQ